MNAKIAEWKFLEKQEFIVVEIHLTHFYYSKIKIGNKLTLCASLYDAILST